MPQEGTAETSGQLSSWNSLRSVHEPQFELAFSLVIFVDPYNLRWLFALFSTVLAVYWNLGL